MVSLTLNAPAGRRGNGQSSLKKIFSTCHQQQAGEIKIYY
jgi:ABC-type sugar transport system ATPase subunit